TEIRRNLAGQGVSDGIPPAAARYIREHGLYEK
ncbi:TPA: nicotinate-nicotinamide nucleotide adenylyltransferase, partial [Neisseria meningitidis]